MICPNTDQLFSRTALDSCRPEPTGPRTSTTLPRRFQTPIPSNVEGSPGLGTEFPCLLVTLLQDYAKAIGKSLALIFVYARQAFYAVIRPLVAALCKSGEAVAHVMKGLGLPPAAMSELAVMLETEQTLLEQHQLPQPFQLDVALNYIATHFTMRGSPDVAHAFKGATPGHRYADVVFALAFQTVLQHIV